ncbi:eCIS core domain-containing protein [Halovivax ruber]
MGDSFSDVQIHTGPTAAKACEEINARAFTVGNHIAFNAGEYDPESPEGQHLLAHVKQQTGAAISMMPQADADLEIDPDPQLEREADQAAEEALSGEEALIVNRLGTDVHIQRMPEGEQIDQARQEADERFGSDVPADPEVLAKEVEQLKANQQQVLEVLSQAQPGAPSEGEWGETATKGLLGSLASMGTGAAVGAAVGSIFPGLGTEAGAAVGTAASGVVGDFVKQGIGWASDNLVDEKAASLEQMYEEISRMYEELKDEGNAHGGATKFGANNESGISG